MQDTKASVIGPSVRLLLGVSLLAISDFLDIFYNTIWGYDVADAAQITLGSDSLGLGEAIKPVKNIIEIVGMVAFLSSDISSYITGQNIVIDGGWSI